MFALAILVGLLSYTVFFLGIFHVLYFQTIFIVTVGCSMCAIAYYSNKYNKFDNSFVKNLDKVSVLLIILFLLQAIINFIGALGPELGFDALWYHLTLPKIFLEQHSIFYIPGGLFYYSTMPKLTEMLYVIALAFQGEILAKVIHFTFGILISIALYQISRKFLDKKFSLLCVVVFYSNLVVAWESTTAYIDLVRTFFEILALWALLNYRKNFNIKWLIMTATMIGFAITTKLIAIFSLLIFIVLFIAIYKEAKFSMYEIAKKIVLIIIITFLIPFPWLLFSFISTGNPFYPVFSSVYRTNYSLSLFNPVQIMQTFFSLFLRSADPINPIYFIMIPVIFVERRKFKMTDKLVLMYSFLSFIIWYITPQTGGGRFILPYLPIISLITTILIRNQKKPKQYIFIGTIIIVSFISICYRGIANSRYIPVILGMESKDNFLVNNLNFNFGDFYDENSEIKKIIRPTSTVLMYGIHNLYYVEFPFVHESYQKTSDNFQYVLIPDADDYPQYKTWKLVYHNSKTKVNLYEKP